MAEICENVNFSYSRIVKLLREGHTLLIRSLAGCALATFGYNNKTNQISIATAISSTSDEADRLPLSFGDFTDLLGSDNIFIRCNAAFEVAINIKQF